MDPLTVGTPAPDFSLPDLQGQLHTLSGWRGRIVVLTFWSSECDWCQRTDAALLADLPNWGGAVQAVWIASNLGESRAHVARAAIERHLPLVLFDEQQSAANLFAAQVTPHIFVIDAEGVLRYQGAFDDVTFRQRTPTRHYALQAIQSLLEGYPPDPFQTPAYGCAIVRPLTLG